MAYRSVILGCGPRAQNHAAPYPELTRAELVAVCDLDANRADAMAARCGVAAFYDLDRLLAEVRPDILHLVTLPSLRVPLLQATAGVPLVIVEKPLALTPGDARAVAAATAGRKVVVNHQCRLFDSSLRLARAAASGELGDHLRLKVGCYGNLASQGTHMLDLMCAVAGEAAPQRVLGAVGGGMDTGGHAAPHTALGSFELSGGQWGVLEAGAFAPPAHEETQFWMHCQTQVTGTLGTAWASLAQGWQVITAAGVERGETNWQRDDYVGQRRLVDLCCDWLDDDAKPHPTRVEVALRQLNALFGLTWSALEHRVVDLPCDPPDDLLERLPTG